MKLFKKNTDETQNTNPIKIPKMIISQILIIINIFLKKKILQLKNTMQIYQKKAKIRKKKINLRI